MTISTTVTKYIFSLRTAVLFFLLGALIHIRSISFRLLVHHGEIIKCKPCTTFWLISCISCLCGVSLIISQLLSFSIHFLGICNSLLDRLLRHHAKVENSILKHFFILRDISEIISKGRILILSFLFFFVFCTSSLISTHRCQSIFVNFRCDCVSFVNSLRLMLARVKLSLCHCALG